MSDANFPFKTSIVATGNSALGRGVHGAIPLHLVFEARDIKVNGSAKIQAGTDAEVSFDRITRLTRFTCSS